jgi:hypothetical protein
VIAAPDHSHFHKLIALKTFLKILNREKDLSLFLVEHKKNVITPEKSTVWRFDLPNEQVVQIDLDLENHGYIILTSLESYWMYLTSPAYTSMPPNVLYWYFLLKVKAGVIQHDSIYLISKMWSQRTSVQKYNMEIGQVPLFLTATKSSTAQKATVLSKKDAE